MAVKRPRGRRTSRPSVVVARGTAVVVALLAGVAGAHPEPAPAGTNRYVTATVASGRVEIADAWLEGALAAGEERRRLDADGDGRISDGELARARDGARAGALAVTLDGTVAPSTVAVAIDLGGDAAVGTTPVAIERRMTLALGPLASDGGTHTLRLELARDPPRVVTTEVTVDLEPGWVLGAAAPGAARALFRGPRRSTLEDRSVTFTFAAAPNALTPARGPRAAVVVPLALLALLAGAALAGAHRPHRRPAGGRLVELGTHVAFPAVISTLLAYARPRLLPEAPRALWAAAAVVAAGLALWAAAREHAVGYGHDDGTVVARLVPSAEMLSLAVMGAVLPVGIAALGAAAFGIVLAMRGSAVTRAAQVTCAIAAAIAVAAAVILARL